LPSVRHWSLNGIETPGGTVSPVVLHSDDEARAVLIGMEPGQELGDHQVREHAFVLVVSGSVDIAAGGDSLEAEQGTLLQFEPGEEHAVRARDGGARLLLLLAGWPGPGHYPPGAA
jgi:quercetin dioxygenase-like cupin family protein